MRAGNLKSLLTIQASSIIGSKKPTAYEANVVWMDWRADISCGVEVRRGREHWDSLTKQRYAEDVWLFRVRYDEAIGVSATHRIIHDDQIFDIKSMRPDAQNRVDLILECTLNNGLHQQPHLIAGIEDFIRDGWVSFDYDSFTVTAKGGTAPYQFLIESSVPGLKMDEDSGAMTGKPTEAGEFEIIIRVTDSAGDEFLLPSFKITVHP